MAKKKTPKTNAARILDRLGISYELLTYPVDESDLSAVHVAEATGIPLERIYKTLVVRGGCSPLGAKKRYPVYCDESILRQDRICVSAGRRGEQLALVPHDLVRAADATTARLIR